MGVMGAAVATGLSQTAGALIALTHFLFGKGSLRIRRFSPRMKLFRKILFRGLPEAIAQFSTPVTTLCMNRTLMAFFGDTGINAFAIISYLSSFTMAVFFGASEGMQPLFGQAYGAREDDDLRAFYRAGLWISVIGSALCVAVYVLFPRPLCRMFGEDAATLAFTADHMWEYCWGFVVGSVNSMLSAYLYFVAALAGTPVLAVCAWIAVAFFDRELLLLLFGAEETLLPLAQRYFFPVEFSIPSFLLTQLMAAFLHNDGNAGLAAKAVLFGCIFDVSGDWFFVFFLDMGVMGAGLATVLGSVFSLFLMCTHFFGKKCTLRLEKPAALFPMLKSICITGFSTFFIDVAMGILTMLFNRQILRWHGTEASSSPSARSSSAVPTAFGLPCPLRCCLRRFVRQ